MLKGEINQFRSYLLQEAREENDIPKIYRWLYKVHLEDSISRFEPYCSKYCTYNALPLPADAEEFGTYNLFMTEHHRLLDQTANQFPDGPPRGVSLAECFDEEFLEITRQPSKGPLRNPKWLGTREGFHPVVYVRFPMFWEKDLKGRHRTIADGPNFRWLMIFKYPEGVTRQEGDDWFFQQLAPQLIELPQLHRFVTSAAIPGKDFGPWQRVAELWFDDSENWHDAIVKSSAQFAKPTWATHDRFPYLAPYEDFTGMFLLDMADSNHLTQFMGYIPAR